MSFMAGFGEAFSRSYERSAIRRANMEDDIFKLTFNTYLENQKDIKTKQSQEAADAQKAKALAQTLSGVDQKAATAQIYTMLRSGLEEDFILEELKKPGAKMEFDQNIRENKGALEEQTEAVTAPGSSETKDQNLQQVQQRQQAEGSWKDTFAGGLFGSPYSKRDKAADKAQQRIAETTGVPLEQVQGTLSGSTAMTPSISTTGLKFTPGRSIVKDELANLNSAAIELAEAQNDMETNPSPAGQERLAQAERRITALKNAEIFKAQAEAAAKGMLGTAQRVKVIGQDGSTRLTYAKQGPGGELLDAGTNEPIQGQTVPFTEDEQKAYQDLAKDVSKQSEEYQNRVTSMTSLMRGAGDMATLVDQTGGAVLGQRVGNLSQYLQGWGTDLTSAFQLYENLKKTGNTVGANPDDTFAVEEMEKKINSVISQGVGDIGTARALFDAKVKILAYKIAAMEGQDGRGLAEVERQMFESIAEGGNSPEKFNQNMANIMFSRLNDLVSDRNVLNGNNIQIKAFQEAWGWSEPPFALAMDPEQVIQSDPKLKAIYDRFAPYNNLNIRGAGTPDAKATGGTMNDPEVVSPQSKADYDALPSGTRYRAPDGSVRVKP